MDSLLFSSAGLLIVAIGFIVLHPTGPGKIYIGFSTVVHLYYMPLGLWYWFEYKDALFLGVDWNDQLSHISHLYVVCFTIQAVCIHMMLARRLVIDQLTVTKQPAPGNHEWGEYEKLCFLTCMVIGVVCTTYVISRANSFDSVTSVATDPFLLLCTQISDILIPAALYLIATRRHTGWALALGAYYVIYALFVGYRYKLLLFGAPLVVLYYFWAITKSRLHLLLALGVTAFTVCIFSIMTLARQKFGGIDLSDASSWGLEEVLFGLFAEANINFGLASTLTSFGTRTDFVGWQPLADSITQWIPRFLYPDKKLYEHLDEIAIGLGNSREAFDSATSQPYFAEFFAMHGEVGMFVMVAMSHILAGYLLVRAIRGSRTWYEIVIASSLVAVFFTFYWFSRGSIAQVFKGFVFIITPYFLLLSLRLRVSRPSVAERLS